MIFVIVSKKLVLNDFWLFLRSLSYIGSSGRLVGRISTKSRPNQRQPLPLEDRQTDKTIRQADRQTKQERNRQADRHDRT